MNKPLVSVLMTAYNREAYIEEAIKSVLGSTYQNFELIIVDDRSKDRTVEIARQYEAKDPRVKVYVNEKNLGDYPNRNQAASYASGKYLKYVDADDYLYPTGLEIMLGMMENFPEAGWGLCSLDQFIEQPFPFMLSAKQAYEYHYLGPGLFHKAPLSSIIKKNVFDQVGGFKPLRMVGDFEMWHRLAQTYPVVLMPGGIVWYRVHDQQEITHRAQFDNQYKKIKLDYLKDAGCPLGKDQLKTIFSGERKKMLRAALSSLLRFKISKFFYYIEAFKNYI